MGSNVELARIFAEIADLLEVLGQEDRFKIEAYRRASRTIEALGEDIGAVAQRGGLRQIPGIGEALEAKIRDYLKTGKIPYHEKLRAEVPPGVLALLGLPGVGPKSVRRFVTELGVDGPEALSKAIADGRLALLSGFGPKKAASIAKGLEAIGAGPSAGARRPILEVWELAERVVAELKRKLPGVELSIAGSLRRARETIGDIDLLASSERPETVFDAFSGLDGVKEVLLRGETKESVIFRPGIQIDLRVVAPESAGAALQYFTGSKEHNIRLRTLARNRGLKINEYGVYRDSTSVAGRTEREVYAALGLGWMAPELREDGGEIEAAQDGRTPAVLDTAELRGDLGLRWTDGAPVPVREWVGAARAAGLSYVGAILPDGRDEELAATVQELRSRWEGSGGGPSLRLLLGVETPSARDRPVPAGIDYLVRRAGPEPPAPEVGSPVPLFLTRLGAGTTREAWIRWAGNSGVGLEVTPHPREDGLDSAEVRSAVGEHRPLSITSGAERPEELHRLALAAAIARRGWARTGDAVNSRPLSDLRRIPPAGPGASGSSPRRVRRKAV